MTGFASPALGAPFDHATLAETARRAFILPGYRRFGAALGKLDDATGTLCGKPSKRALDTVRAAYRAVIAQWGRIEIVTFGPIAREDRLERIFFWPDRRGIGQRQIRQILRRKDEGVLAPGALAEKSVAVQGLGALERVLYGDGADALADAGADAYRCRYGRAITRNLEKTVADIIAGWADGGSFARFWQAPGPDNPVYLEASETTLELVKAFDQAIESVRDRRIAPALGLGPQRRVRRPVLWRSKFSMVLIAANVAGARDLFEKGGLAAGYVARNDGSDEAAGDMSSIASEFKLTLRTLDQLAGAADPFAATDIKSKLVALGYPLKNIRMQAVGHLKQAAGLSVGFNASDGD